MANTLETQAWTADQMPAMQGQTALITGANSGIGYQAAVGLARKGARVLLGCRSAAKGQAALERLHREVPGASAEVLSLDMASLESIAQAALTLTGRQVVLDLLINNAGVMALPKRELTADGFERQFGTNHLGHFALTGLLLPRLMAAPAPRVVTVASLAHRNARIDFANLQSEKSYKPMVAYGVTKLANILFARELNRRAVAANSKLISLAVHPGVSVTNIFENGPGASGPKAIVFKLLSKLVMQSDEAGALPTLYAATSPLAAGGQYIGPDGFMGIKGSPVVVEPKPQALDEATGRKLWQVSEQLTGVTYPSLSSAPEDVPAPGLRSSITDHMSEGDIH